MKRLCLVRHAKSDWSDPETSDHGRPLNARGERAAAAMAIWLRQEEIEPTRILCSTALRARQTAALLAARLHDPPEVEYDRSLYLADPDDIVKRLGDVEDTVSCVMVVGHNPGLEELVEWLDPDQPTSAKFPTCAVALFRLRVDSWADLTGGAAELERLMVPKQLV